jgi:type II restriction enzyme
MNFNDLIRLYEDKKSKYGSNAYNYISALLKEAKKKHKEDWDKSPTPQKDHEQSWKGFKGKNLEKLVVYIIRDEVERLGLKVIDGNTLERKRSSNLPDELNKVKRNILIDYGEFGSHLPDVDIVIYNPETYKIIAVLSSKVTLRERIAQTGYWKIKLAQDHITEHIKVFFITPDEDKTLSVKKPAKKGRAIVEVDTDGSYIMTEDDIEESKKVKKFEKFFEDLRSLINART